MKIRITVTQDDGLVILDESYDKVDIVTRRTPKTNIQSTKIVARREVL